MEVEKPFALISQVGGEHGYQPELADLIKQHFCTITYRDFMENQERYAGKIKVLFSWKFRPYPEPSLLRRLPALKAIAIGGVGVDHLDLPFIAGLGIKVSNTPHVVSDATADMAMALLLASARKIFEGHRIAVAPETTQIPQDLMGIEVTGSTLGIVGMGDVGYKIAERSRGFNMKVLYHNRTRRSAEDESAVGAHYCERLDDLLRQSDFLMLAVPLTPQTSGLIGQRELALMKPTATLINISRGLVVDQDALLEALRKGVIHAAAMDVTYPEPLPRDHPLLSLANVIITPHIGINTLQTTHKMVQTMVGNALAALNGDAMPDEVKPK
ncbi:uncharacterized protein LOC115825699 [Chanos chanos]|uniref:Glyoxylate reductase/hydroxypyruvate reductase n=1 Tax=Chanos chanos TaxID=29144 RepID=A0A6J2WP40_CHACN|nr:uncharacterized protein LOC115825699 [Chanos chanos]